jgi:hypothetical protein
LQPLLEAGIQPTGIRPPTLTPGSCSTSSLITSDRFAVSSATRPP